MCVFMKKANLVLEKFDKNLGLSQTPPPCIGERTISFLVKFESSVLCKLMLYIGHLGYLIPHLMNKKADFRS